MKHLTLRQAADATGLDPSTLRKRCRAGNIPGAIPPSPDWLIPATAIPTLRRRPAGRPPKQKPPP